MLPIIDCGYSIAPRVEQLWNGLQFKSLRMSKILLFFKYHGYQSGSQISHRELENIIAFNSDPFQQNDPLTEVWRQEILSQAWENSNPDARQRVSVSKYVRSLYEIHNQLNTKILAVKEQLALIKKQVDRVSVQIIVRTSESIESAGEDHQLHLYKSKLSNLLYLINNYEQDCKMLGYQSHILLHQFQKTVLAKPSRDIDHESSTCSQQHSIVYQSGQTSRLRVYNNNLRVLFFLSFSFILVQMFVMFLKFSYLDLLIGFLLLSIFLFSCFHHSYIKILLMFISCSFIFDIGWVLGKAHGYWFPNKFSAYSDIDPSMHRLIILTIAIQTLLKATIGGYLWPWRKLETEDVYYVKTFGSCDFTLTRSQAKIKLQQKLIDDVFCGVIY